MKRLAIAVVAITAISTGAAWAADLPAATYTKAPAIVAPVYSWTGFYVGGDAGGEWTDAKWTTTCLQPGRAGTVCPGNLPTILGQNNPSSFNTSGFKGGVYAGYNWQVSSWVWGFEGDVQWVDAKRTKAGIPGAENFTAAGAPGLDSSSIKETWDASLRLRGGVLVTPSVLLYGTGGVAFAHVESSAHCQGDFPIGWCFPGSVFQGLTQTASSDRVGWTVGAGVEAMIAPNWLLRGEYRYADYGKFSSTLFTGSNGIRVNQDAIAFDTRFHTSTLTVGIAYKFGGPVVARY